MDTEIMDSDLSFTEKVIHESYMAERKKREALKYPSSNLELPAHYISLFNKKKGEIEKEIKNGKLPEHAIWSYVYKELKEKDNVFPSPIHSLEMGETNCLSSTALFLCFAEALDYKLFESCKVADMKPKEGCGHVYIKIISGDIKTRNIDRGDFSDSGYEIAFGVPPRTEPKNSLFKKIRHNTVLGPIQMALDANH